MHLPLLLAVETIALTGATVHTLEPGSTPGPAVVLIRNERIAAVGPDVEIPADARRVDLSGLHLIPGLVDGMVSLDPDHDRLYVDAGVTLVRDTGNDLVRILAETDRNARERGPGPWICAAGAALDGSPPTTTYSIVLLDAAMAEAKVTRLLTQMDVTPDFLSVLPGLPRDAWAKTIEMAHKVHKQVWGLPPRGVTLSEAVAAGQDGLYHLDAFLPEGKTWDDVTLKELEPAIQAVQAGGVAVTPTLARLAALIVEPREDAPELAALGPFYHQTWLEDARERRKIATADRLKQGLARLEKQSALVLRLHEAGVRLVPGSGAPSPWLMPGVALLDELLLWKRAGIPAADCLRAATAGAAEALGEHLRGTIKVGKHADLVAVRGDPEEDLNALRKPACVVLRGRVLLRDELDALGSELRAAQTKLREEFAQPLAVDAPELPAGDVVLRGHVETRTVGVRVSAERFAVVRTYDGALVYCGLVRTPGQASVPDTITKVRQTITGGDLTAFEVDFQTGPRNVNVKGESAGGRMNITRRIDGGFAEGNPVNERLAFVDCGSVTSWLILGYHRKPSSFHAVFFEDTDAAVGLYDLALDFDGSTHVLRTPIGFVVVETDEHGLPKLAKRAQGPATAVTALLDGRIEDGRGLPMPADKKAMAGCGPDGQRRQAPAAPDADPKAGTQKQAATGKQDGAAAGAHASDGRPAPGAGDGPR